MKYNYFYAKYLHSRGKVQEAKKKFSIINNNNVVIHLIGPLQTNKVKSALKLFNTIQSVDRPKLVVEISKYLNSNLEDKIVTRDFYIQVNIGNEKYDICIDTRTYKIFEQSILNYIDLKTKDDFKKFVYEQQKKN